MEKTLKHQSRKVRDEVLEFSFCLNSRSDVCRGSAIPDECAIFVEPRNRAGRAVEDLAIGVLTGKFEVPDHAMRLQVFDMLSPIAGSEGRVVEILAADSTDDAIRGLEVPEIMAGVGKKRVAQVGIGFPECI